MKKVTFSLLIIFTLVYTKIYSQDNTAKLPDGISLTFPCVPNTVVDTVNKSTSALCASGNKKYIVTVVPIPEWESNMPTLVLAEPSRRDYYTSFISKYNGKLLLDEEIKFKEFIGYDFYLSLTIEYSPIKFVKGRMIVCGMQFVFINYYYETMDDETYQAFLNSLTMEK